MIGSKITKITPAFYVALLEFLLNAKRYIVAVGDECTLTAIQTITLLLIDNQNPRPMGSLGQLFHCDAGNVTGIIDGLEQKGLVERRNAPNDRRIKTVCLLPKGQALQQQILERLASSGDFPFDSLNARERQQLVRIVEKLAA